MSNNPYSKSDPADGVTIPADLQTNRTDRLAAIGRGAAAALPFIGGTVAEILTAIIPNQRLERIVGFLAALEVRLTCFERDHLAQRLREPDNVDLLEDAIYQAARATTRDRFELLAAMIKNGLTAEELEHIHRKRLLDIFGRLNDAEMIILQSYLRENEDSDALLGAHQHVLHGPIVDMHSPSDELDRAAVHDTYRRHLRELGLLRERFKRPRRGELPDFDERTGMMKASGYELTRLGGLLLRHLDLTDEEF